jgi:hypothetical protein
MKTLEVDRFLERVRHMPDEEAEIEIVLRLESHRLEYAVATQARQELAGNSKRKAEFVALGRELQILSQDGGRMREELEMVRKRMERLNWGRTVRAVFGDEGYEQCRVWMLANCVLPGKQTGEDLHYFARQYGIELERVAA